MGKKIEPQVVPPPGLLHMQWRGNTLLIEKQNANSPVSGPLFMTSEYEHLTLSTEMLIELLTKLPDIFIQRGVEEQKANVERVLRERGIV